jgi:hypothetical protein
VIRRNIQGRVSFDSVESSTKSKQVKFDLQKSGEDSDSQSERVETGLH